MADRSTRRAMLYSQLGTSIGEGITNYQDKSEEQTILDYWKDKEQVTPEELQKFQSLHPNVSLAKVYAKAPPIVEAMTRQKINDLGLTLGQFEFASGGIKPPQEVAEFAAKLPGSDYIKNRAMQVYTQFRKQNMELFKKNEITVGANQNVYQETTPGSGVYGTEPIMKGADTTKEAKPVTMSRVNKDGRTQKVEAKTVGEMDYYKTQGYEIGELSGTPTKDNKTLTSQVTRNARGELVYAFNDGSASDTIATKLPSDRADVDVVGRDLRNQDLADRMEQRKIDKVKGIMTSLQNDKSKIDQMYDTAISKGMAGAKEAKASRIAELESRYGAILEPYRKDGLWHGWDKNEDTSLGSLFLNNATGDKERKKREEELALKGWTPQQIEKAKGGSGQSVQTSKPASYTTADEVKKDFKAGKINQSKALEILRNQFGMK
jgi:hypothetical protein